jgi:hypothetical protein
VIAEGATMRPALFNDKGELMMQSIRDIADDCLDKTGRLSLREDILGVYGSDNPQTRSTKAQLDRIENTDFVKIALVTISGANPTIQRDLDNTNLVFESECDVWVYPTASIVVTDNSLLTLSQDDCAGSGHSVSDEEDELFDLGRNLGANVVGYYIRSDTAGFLGCAAHPPGRRGFWVGDAASQWTFAHELGHVVGDNSHVNNNNNLMTGNGTFNITNPPPNLSNSQCDRIEDDDDVISC